MSSVIKKQKISLSMDVLIQFYLCFGTRLLLPMWELKCKYHCKNLDSPTKLLVIQLSFLHSKWCTILYCKGPIGSIADCAVEMLYYQSGQSLNGCSHCLCCDCCLVLHWAVATVQCACWNEHICTTGKDDIKACCTHCATQSWIGCAIAHSCLLGTDWEKNQCVAWKSRLIRQCC